MFDVNCREEISEQGLARIEILQSPTEKNKRILAIKQKKKLSIQSKEGKESAKKSDWKQ